MKKTLLIGLAILFSGSTFSQIIFEKLFQISPNKNNLRSYAVSVIESADGGYIIAGNTKNTTGSDRMFTMKLNSNGDSVWSKTYDYSGFVQASFKNIFYNKKNNLTVFAHVLRQGAGAWAYFFEINPSNGDTIKVSKFQTTNGYVAQEAVQLADSSYVFTTINGGTTSRIYRVNQNMTQNWMYQPFPSQLDSVPTNALFNGIVNNADTLYFSGRLGFGGAVETYFAKWDIQGNKKFFKKYGFGRYLSMNDLEITNQNIALLAGNVQVETSSGLFTDAFAILELNLKGDSLKLITIDGPVTDNAYNITKANGKYLVTGLGSEPIEGAQVVFVAAIDESGKLLWNEQLFIPAASGATPTHYGYQTIETSTGEYLMVGKRNGEGAASSNENVYVAKFTPKPVSVSNLKSYKGKAFVFPNPASYQFFVSDINFEPQQKVVISIRDILGKEITSTQTTDELMLPICIDELKSGLYFVYKNNAFLDKIQVIK